MANVVTTQPQVQEGGLLVTPVHGHRQWSTGLFDCFTDIGSCLKGYFCLPCTLCNISSRLGDNMCMPCCVPGALITMRTRTRTLGGIKGTICTDCMVAQCCFVCATCQMDRELNNMGIH